MDHLFYFCLVLLCFHARLFVNALWSLAGKGLTSLLSFVMSNFDVVTFPQVWCLIVSIPDLCPLSYFHRDILFGEMQRVRTLIRRHLVVGNISLS